MKLPISESKTRYNIEALARGLEILALFSSERPTLAFPQIVALLGMHKSTVYRMIATLESSHFLEQDPITRQYRPGIRVLQLGFTAINSMELHQAAHPHLEKLAQLLGETVSMAVLDDFRTIYVDRIRNQSIVGVVMNVGSSLPAHCSSLGKVLLADLPQSELDSLLAVHELAAYTPQTITDPQDLSEELGKIRQAGYAIGDEELALGLRAVSAPLRDATRRAVAAVNVTGLADRMSYQRIEEEIIPALLGAVRRISSALGYLPNPSA